MELLKPLTPQSGSHHTSHSAESSPSSSQEEKATADKHLAHATANLSGKALTALARRTDTLEPPKCLDSILGDVLPNKCITPWPIAEDMLLYWPCKHGGPSFCQQMHSRGRIQILTVDGTVKIRIGLERHVTPTHPVVSSTASG